MNCEHKESETTYEVYMEGSGQKHTFSNLTEASHKHTELHKENPEWRLCQIDKCKACGYEHRVCIKEFLA